MKPYDYLIVGAGFFGSTFANVIKDKKRCLIIDKRNHIGGNCFTEKQDDIVIHKYGSHIFHTDDKAVWDFVNKFVTFDNYVNRVKANCDGKIYSLPINLHTFNQLWGVSTPEEAKQMIAQKVIKNENPKNAEEFLWSVVGKEITSLFYEGYTKKHWNLPLKELPMSTYMRLPIRFDHNDNYYNHKYQGIPMNGYTEIFEKMLTDINVKLNVDYFNDREYFNGLADKILYTGPIDKFYNYKYGKLKYISIDFKFEKHEINDYQGCAVMSHPLENVEYTKTIEHKHFSTNPVKNKTIISKEYPIKNFNDSTSNSDPFYPVNDKDSQEIYKKYLEESKREPNIIFGGRLASYKYYDMNQITNEFIKELICTNYVYIKNIFNKII